MIARLRLNREIEPSPADDQQQGRQRDVTGNLASRVRVEENIGSTLTFYLPAVPSITESGTEYL